jgi:ribosomal protein L11 methylase PrmA
MALTPDGRAIEKALTTLNERGIHVVETEEAEADEKEGETRGKRESEEPARERKYKKLKKEIVAGVKSLRLNQARIDALVEQLYEINKRLAGYEGRLMRLAESHGIAREDFLENYKGSTLDPPRRH